MRRAGEDAHPYERGWEDGWDAPKDEVKKILSEKQN